LKEQNFRELTIVDDRRSSANLVTIIQPCLFKVSIVCGISNGSPISNVAGTRLPFLDEFSHPSLLKEKRQSVTIPSS